MSRDVIKHQDRRHVSKSHLKPRRYEVHYKVPGINQWQMQATNSTRIGAMLDYYAVPLGATERRIVDNGKDWRKRA